ADEPEDASFFDAQIDAVQRNGGAERLAEAARFYAGHGFNPPPSDRSTAGRRPPEALPESGRGAGWLRRPAATAPPETSRARPASEDRARRRWCTFLDPAWT